MTQRGKWIAAEGSGGSGSPGAHLVEEAEEEETATRSRAGKAQS